MRSRHASALAVLIGIVTGVTLLGSASAGVSEMVTLTGFSEKDATDSKKAVVECIPAEGGDLRTGGGAQVVGGGANVALITDKPTGTHGWMARAVEVTPTSEPWRLKVFALCANG